MARGWPKGKSRKSVSVTPSSDAVAVQGVSSTNVTHEDARDLKPVEPMTNEIPPLNEGMKWFEAPDGKLYEGPKDKNFIIINGETVNPRR